MKTILSVVGARPNFMKVAPLHRAFHIYSDELSHKIVHTGQHYDAAMSDAFFADLDMPMPTWFLGVGSGSHARQTAAIMTAFDDVLTESQPDYVIVVGDVNSTIACALTSVKRGIRTAHVEAGLRSRDRSMPEELNRLATDAIVDDLFVTEQDGVANLLREGHAAENVHFVGNTMIDSLMYAIPKTSAIDVVSMHGLPSERYALVTLHRPSNVDNPAQLDMLMDVISEIATSVTVVFPVHPRTRQRLTSQIRPTPPNVRLIDPQGYLNFLALMKGAMFVLTDSGGIQEETTALSIPCITARTTTERPSTVTLGTNRLVPPTREALLDAIHDVLAGKHRVGTVPPLWDGHASERIAQLVASFTS
jgi:UDP-N-acetylglucosamine 2-epimerase (non-hydrolysing)